MLRNPGLRKSVEQPVLDLNFAAAQIGSNAAPDSRIDFSRGTNAWFVDSDGLVKKSPHNLHTYSEQFDNAYWIKGAGSITANAIAAPDGTLTADLFTEDTANTTHNLGVNLGFNYVSGTTYASSVYVKANGRTKLQLNWRSNWFPSGVSVDFDLTAETATLGSAAVLGKIENVGNGWYRCTAMATADATGSSASDLYINIQNDSGDNSYTGDGSSGMYVWGAQLSQHYVLPVGNPYVKTEASAVYAARLDHDPSWFMSAAQEQNLLETTDLDDGSFWGLGRSTVVEQSSVQNPFGGTDGVYLNLESSVGGSSYIYLFGSTNWQQYVTEGKQYTLSIYAKQFNGQKVTLRSPNDDFRPATFNLETVSIENQDSLLDNATIEDVGNGWFRCSIVDTISTFNSGNWIVAYLENDFASPDYGLYYYGLQLEVGSTASTYHRTEGAPYYGPGATPKGLLIEEARTNAVPYSEDFANAAWTKTRCSISSNAALAPDGTTTASKLVEDSSTNTHFLQEALTIASSTAFTYSVFLKAGERDHANIHMGEGQWKTGGYAALNVDLADGTVSVVDATYIDASSIEDYGNGWFRVSVSSTSGSSQTTGVFRIFPTLSDFGTSYAGDGSSGIFVWGAQVEQGSFPTSYIQTTGTTLTRNADVATMGPTTGGTELVTNGTFDTDVSNWTANSSNISYESGVLRITADTAGVGANIAVQSVSTVIGRRYRATLLHVGQNAGGRSAKLQIRNAANNSTIAESSTTTNNTTITVDFTAIETSITFRIRWDGISSTTTSHYIDVDNASLRELYPFEQYNPSEGTYYIQSKRSTDVNSRFYVLNAISDGTSDQMYLWHWEGSATTVRWKIEIGGVASQDATRTTALDADMRLAAPYKLNNGALALNGTSTGTDTNVTIPAVDKVALGYAETADNFYLNGHIKEVSYYARRLSNEALKALTDD